MPVEPVFQQPSSVAPFPQANNVFTPAPPMPTQDPMAAIVQQMMQMNTNLMNTMQAQTSSTSSYQNSGSGRGGGRGNRNGGRGGGRGRNNRSGTRRFIMRYCWSCGWCVHDGNHCRSRKDGHKVEATVYNRMDGSTEGLPPGYE